MTMGSTSRDIDSQSFDDSHRPSQYHPIETPALIVGGGPVGLLCSILLARYGINSTIVERHSSRLGQPKAHVLNPRSLEIMRQAGLDTKRLRNLGVKPADADLVRFATSMVGSELGNIPFDKQDRTAYAFTPEPLFNIPQPVLEDYLREVVIMTGKVSIWRDSHWQSSQMTTDGFGISKILNRQTNTIFECRSKHLLCCDGANSRSREQLQIPFPAIAGNPQKPLHHVTIHFNADLRKMKSGTLFFIWSLSQTGTFICYDRGSSWVFVLTYDPTIILEPKAIFTEEFCRSQIDQAIGEKVDYNIQSITIWSSDTRVADFYQSKIHPTAFLVGDSAHAFPPSGGLGINTGFADAQNLVWKIHAVENKWADDCLLQSYERERRPVALANARFSNNNKFKMRSLAKAVFGPDPLKREDPEMRMKDPSTRQEIEQGILEQFDHFNSVNLQLGYIYGDVSYSTKDCSTYKPTVVRGARLPHAWVQRNGLTCSTLDLVDGRSFVLLASPNFEAAPETSLEKCYHLGSHRVPVEVLRQGLDFQDVNGDWSRLAEIYSNGGLLVRPDQHVLCVVSCFDDLLKLESFV